MPLLKRFALRTIKLMCGTTYLIIRGLKQLVYMAAVGLMSRRSMNPIVVDNVREPSIQLSNAR